MSDPVLILSPHTDDGELGCGGAIAKLIEQGEEVHYIAFSDAQKSLPQGVPADTLVHEVESATKILGIDQENVHILDFETRCFPESRQKILDTLYEIRVEINPKVVFTPSLKDVHQDHQVVTTEALRAFKKTASTILGYEEPWNCFTFDTTVFNVLSDEHIQKKVEALNQYKSQRHRDYFNEDFVLSLARIRGTQVGEKYAEAFEIMRLIMR